MEKQLLLFEQSSEQKYEDRIKKLLDTHQRTVKAQFGKIATLQKEIQEVKHELSILISAICRGNKYE